MITAIARQHKGLGARMAYEVASELSLRRIWEGPQESWEGLVSSGEGLRNWEGIRGSLKALEE